MTKLAVPTPWDKPALGFFHRHVQIERHSLPSQFNFCQVALLIYHLMDRKEHVRPRVIASSLNESQRYLEKTCVVVIFDCNGRTRVEEIAGLVVAASHEELAGYLGLGLVMEEIAGLVVAASHEELAGYCEKSRLDLKEG
jgi:hypothetical protein